jgi:hypothetical protein
VVCGSAMLLPAHAQFVSSPEDIIDCAGVPNGTAKDRGCGCGKPAPGQCGCSSQVDLGCGCGKVAPNECGCTGQVNELCGCGKGTSCLSTCPYNIVPVYRKRGDGNKEVNYAYDRNNRPAHIHQCVDQNLRQWDAECAGDRNGSKDCLAKKILGPYFNGGSGIQYVTFDAACNRNLSNEAFFVANRQCLAMWTITASPISLIIGPGDENDGRVIFTQFPLNPSRQGAWYQWRASSRAPLVVYDPSHRGEITSAHQLFGEWTFGGKRVASSKHNILSDVPVGQSVEWENGFEALATLDANDDDKLSGKELEPLGLWFDENRDGVSQKGEVRPIQAAGVTTLFVTADKRNEVTKSIYATRGYERTVNGEASTGMLVDWYGKEGISRDHLIASLSQLNQLTDEGEETQSVLKPEELAAVKRQEMDIDGLWQWNYDDGSYGGILGFYGLEGGGVKGFSMIDTSLTDQAKTQLGVEHVAATIPLRGSVTHGSKGRERTLRFSIYSKGASHTETTVNISPDGKKMSGKSTVISDAKGRDGDDLTYTWTAMRFGS